MSYLFLALLLQVLAPGLVLLVAYTTGKLAVRVLEVPGFRILRAPAPGTAWRALGVRAASTLGAFLTCLFVGFAAAKQTGVELPTTTVHVLDSSPARRGGLKDGDGIVAIDGRLRTSWEDVRVDLRSTPNTRTLTLERNGERLTRQVTPNENRAIGVQAVLERRPISTGDATARALMLCFVPLRLFVPSSEKVEVMGPVGIAKSVSQGSGDRLGTILYLGALVAAYAWLAVAAFHVFDALLQRFRRA